MPIRTLGLTSVLALSTAFPLLAEPVFNLVAAFATPALADLSLASRTPGLDLVALDTLPPPPQDRGETAFCNHLFVETVTTPGGQDAAGKGWHVTAELPFGDDLKAEFSISSRVKIRSEMTR